MVCLWLEIGGYSVLKRLHPDALSDALAQVKRLFRYDRRVKFLEEGGAFLFLYEETDGFLHSLTLILASVEKFFDSEKDFFQGNLVYVDIAASPDIRSNFDRIQKRLFASLYDQGIVFSPEFEQCYAEPLLKLGFDIHSIASNAYGETLSQKRDFLHNVILYARYATHAVLTEAQMLSLLTDPVLAQPVYQNINFNPEAAFKTPLKQIHFAQVKAALGYQVLDISKILTQYLYEQLLTLFPAESKQKPLAHFFVAHASGDMRLPAVLFLAKTATLSYRDEFAKELESHLLSTPNYPENPSDLCLTEQLIRFYQAMVCCDYEEVVSLQSQLVDWPESGSFFLELERKLALADCYLSLRYPNEALKFAKEVLFQIGHRHPFPWFLLNANFLIAHSMLQKSKPFEAERYFSFSCEGAKSFQWNEWVLLSLLSLSLLAFLKGAFDLCLRYFDELDDLLRSHSVASDAHALYAFFKGRVRFELGDYNDAAVHFEALEQLARNNGLTTWIEMAKRWQARSLIYRRNFAEGIRLLESLRSNPENHCFLAEGYFFQQKFQKAYDTLALIDKNAFPPDRFISPYINLFKSAFINFEDRMLRYSGDQTAFKMRIRFFKALLAAHLGNREPYDAVKPLLRGELKSEGDPASRLYCLFFAKAAQLLDPDDIHLDALTSINRSFKFLNEYSGNTRDPDIRLRYLKNNFWNREITEFAKRLRLIEKQH